MVELDNCRILACDHMCHIVGLNPWIRECPICGCLNHAYDPDAKVPATFEELLGG
jgi:hypothetical protein